MDNVDNQALNWLDNNELSYKIWNNKYRYNNESFEQWLDRVSGGNESIKQLIKQKKFIFGGRTLANRGTNRGSLSNCYSIGYVPDSLDGIMDTAQKIAMTFKAQGGQGLSLSKIRPKGSLINNQFKSDGIVPFMEIFNTVTESISQGGSRKGALLMSLDINHPEAETFMTIKSDLKKITKANLSMEIDDEFMNSLSTNDANKKKFKLLAQQACKYAEPGVLFTNRLRNYNLMEFVDAYQIETTNPCGEQPLPKHGACNLSSINVSEYVRNPFTNDANLDYVSLRNDMFEIVKAMDDVLEENTDNHALQEQKDCAKKWRNLGIGIMGLHDTFIKMGIVYGSEQSIFLTKELMSNLFRYAVMASFYLAEEERGNFPGYSPNIWDSAIIKHTFSNEEIAELKKINCLRNCALLSIAPTGSIGTMWNVSTGCEPWFSTHYTRNTKSLEGKDTSFEVWAPVIKQAMDLNWHPECLITANQIGWKQHIDIQAACQEFVDASISKTCNLPKTTTPEEIEELYKYAWSKGLKGCTVYVDGSRDPILTTEQPKTVQNKQYDCISPVHRSNIGTTFGETHQMKCACGKLYVTCNKDKQGNLVEIFTHTSKGGICQANLNAVTRMASLGLRSGVKVAEIIDQLKGIHCPACQAMKAKGQKLDGISCPDIVSKVIGSVYNNKQEEPQNTGLVECPECHQKTLRMEGGCVQCGNCGYSRCG